MVESPHTLLSICLFSPGIYRVSSGVSIVSAVLVSRCRIERHPLEVLWPWRHLFELVGESSGRH